MTHYTSRFIIAGDLSDAEVVYPLPAWWSRGHEYAWAERFAGPGVRMPYADAAFDRVFCISVFEHPG